MKSSLSKLKITTPQSISLLSKKECEEFINSKKIIDDIEYYYDPIEKKNIKKNSNNFRYIITHCNKLLDDKSGISKLSSYRAKSDISDVILEWIGNPLKINMKSSKEEQEKEREIKRRGINYLDDNDEYILNYKKIYLYLKNKYKMEKQKILGYLPKEHYIFEKDILYYMIDDENKTNDIIIKYFIKNIKILKTDIYEGKETNELKLHREQIKEIYNNSIKDNSEYNIFKNNTYSEIIVIYTNTIKILSYISSLSKYNKHYIEEFRIYNIDENIKKHEEIENQLTDLVELKQLYDKIDINNKINQLIKEEDKGKLKLFTLKDPKYIYLKTLLTGENIMTKIILYYNGFNRIYSYYDNENIYPFNNLEDKKNNIIEDPILELLKDYELDKLDETNLKSPKRYFNNDKEYELFKNTYETMKTKYIKDREKYVEKEDKYTEDLRKYNEGTIKKSPSKPKTPERPIIHLNTINKDLKEDLTIDVAREQIAKYRHIEDKTYNTMKESRKRNLEIYDNFMKLKNKRLIEILKENGINISDSLDKNDIDNLLNKDIEYFKNNVFFLKDETIQQKKLNENALRCISNEDGYTKNIFYDEDDDKIEEPLYKLQLIYKLYYKNSATGKTIIDCFYAPDFYNYVANNMNGVEKLANPLRPEHKLTEEDIERLMKIMRVIKPDIEYPRYYKPPNDIELKISKFYYKIENGIFVDLYISRKLVPEEYKKELEEIKIEDEDSINKYNKIDKGIYYIYKIKLCTLPVNISSGELSSEDIERKITKLFDDGKIIHNYLPPYYDETATSYYNVKINFPKYNNHKWNTNIENQLKILKELEDELSKYI